MDIALQLTQTQNKKLELLNQILLSTQRQKEYIEKDDVENLVREIDNRQKALDDLLLLNKSFEAIKSKGQNLMADIGLQHIEEEIKRVYHSIEVLNDENNKAAQKKLDEYKNHIAEMRKRKKGFESYTNRYIGQDGMYFDKKK